MRSGKTKKTPIATSQGNASVKRKRWRLSKYSAARSRACPRLIALVMSLAAIEPRGLDQENKDSNRINKKPAGVGEQIFAGRIEDAEHQRRQQSSFETAQPANGDDDQEQHEVKHRETGRKTVFFNDTAATE